MLIERERFFLRLYHEEELTYKDIAATTDTAIGTVGKTLHCARRKLKELLANEDGWTLT